MEIKSLESIDITELQNMIYSVESSSKSINEIIERHLPDKKNRDYKKKCIELVHVGKFIHSLDDGFVIEKHTDIPDFVIRNKNVLCGLEHEIVYLNDLKEDDGRVRDLFDFVEKRFQKEYPDIKFLANIYYNTSILKVKKSNYAELITELVNVIYHFYNKNELKENLYINQITNSKHNCLSLTPNPGGHYVADIKMSAILRAINKKEPKIDSYRINSGLQEQWLLLVIGTGGPCGYDLSDEKDFSDLTISSVFSRIYLLHDFDNRSIRLI